MIRAAQMCAARKRYLEMAPVLDEQSRRRFVALEAQTVGHGGVGLMSEISGLARSTIYRGLSDIREQNISSTWANPQGGRWAQAENNRGSNARGRSQESGFASHPRRPDARSVVDEPSHHRPIDRRNDYRHRPQSSG